MINPKYEQIINLPHHTSKRHPRMSRMARAAQFAPFAALTGFDDDINETRIETEVRFAPAPSASSDSDEPC